MSDLRSVTRGDEIILSAIFVEIDGDHHEPDSGTLKLSIYPPGKDPRQGATEADSWIFEATLTSPGTAHNGAAALHCIEAVVPGEDPDTDTGKFYYRFTVPNNAAFGAAFDRWQGTLEFEDLDATFTWAIVGGSAINPGAARLYDNNKIYVEIDGDLEAEDGTTLGSDFTFYFTTTYTPMYSSWDRISLDLGTLIADVPQDTINLAIFEASIQADALTFLPPPLPDNQRKYFDFARRQFVTCAAELILLQEIERQSNVDGKTKTLADLSIKISGGSKQASDILGRLQACQEKWVEVLMSQLGPGTSLQPSMVIKGIYDPDRPPIGRSWESTHHGSDAQVPAANVRKLGRYHLRWRKGFRNPFGHSRFDID